MWAGGLDEGAGSAEGVGDGPGAGSGVGAEVHDANVISTATKHKLSTTDSFLICPTSHSTILSISLIGLIQLSPH
jgi:hypothetical protein